MVQNIYIIKRSPIIISYYIHILNCCIYMMNKYQIIGIFLHLTIGKYEIYPTALRCIWIYTCLLLSFSRISSTGIAILERSEHSDICGCISLQRQQMLQHRSKHIFKGQISCQSIRRQALFKSWIQFVNLYLFIFIYILIGIVQQIHTEKDPFSCLRDYCNIFKGQPCPHKENIQLIEFTHQVGYVAYLCM